MKDLKAMMGKKKEADPMKKESKLGVLKDLRNSMSSMMGEDMKGKMVKATVAAKNPEDLEEGLDKAKEIVSEMPEIESEESSEESSDMSKLIECCESPEEIDEAIKKLQEKKQELLMKD